MQATFFESLLLADAERIHSQTLAWILNLNESVFSNEEKSKFLKRLFQLKDDVVIDEAYFVGTEINNLDIVIRTGNVTFTVENKLKSSEHSGQTDKYLKAIPPHLKSKSGNNYFAFLSLTAEAPKNSQWLAVSFETLLNGLQAVLWNKENKAYLFIEEYIQTLANLVSVFNHFMFNHKEYETVFQDGHKKKHEKNPEALKYREHSYKDYIRKNQLETIFQKAFIKEVVSDLGLSNYYITETHGVALLQVNCRNVTVENKTFVLGFQFQGNTLKINCARENYDKSKANQIPVEMITIFESIFRNQDGFKKLNKPKSKAYMSVSKKLDKQLYEYEIVELKSFIQSVLINLDELVLKFEEELQTVVV